MLKTLRLRVVDFSKDTSGNMSVETVLIFPLLLWFYLSTFTFFDGYRTQSTNIKAAYTIADAISREVDGVSAAELNTFYNMLQFLNASNSPTRMRVTIATRDQDDGTLEVVDSCVRGGGPGFVAHNDARLRQLDDRIPPTPSPNQLIVMETFIEHNPPFSAQLFDDEVPEGGMIDEGMPDGFIIGLKPTLLSNLVVVRPREVQVKITC